MRASEWVWYERDLGGQVLIIVPATVIREKLAQRLAGKIVARESILSAGRLLIEDERVLLAGEDLLSDVSAAVITDSGFMWPVAMPTLTEDQWVGGSGQFDEIQRDERESSSLWFSLLEIINHQVPVCMNPQRAFSLQATKPLAFEMLRQAGVHLPPMVCTNDAEAVAELVQDQPGELLASGLIEEVGTEQNVQDQAVDCVFDDNCDVTTKYGINEVAHV